MIIGIDMDGVLFDSEMDFRVYSELYDMLDLKQNSKGNNGELRVQERFNWNKTQLNNFFNKYYEKIVRNANFMPGAKLVLKMLKDEGHNLVIITARDNKYSSIIDASMEVLRKNDMDIFDKYVWGARDKAKICKDENIDLMIDDYCNNCIKVADKKIKTIYFKAAPSFEIEDSKYIKTLYNWGEIYRYIKEMEK